jgi:UDP-N-acetylmuramyl tripeptide synthase
MIGDAEMKLGSLELEQFLPESVSESGITIINNRMSHAMEFEDIIHKNLIHSGCYGVEEHKNEHIWKDDSILP